MSATMGWVTLMWLVWGCMGAKGKESGQLYSSLAQMEALFDFDERLGELLLLLPEHVPAATRYLESYLGVKMDRGLGREVRGHPLHVFLVLKRLVIFWPHINPLLNTYVNLECHNLHSECDNWAMRGNCIHFREYMMKHCSKACHVSLPPGFRERITEVVGEASSITMPSRNDLRGAALALSRLQVHYRIPISSFMAGRIENARSTAKLTVEDCLFVAESTYLQGKYGDAWLWYDYCHASAHMDPRLQEEITARMEKVEGEHDENFIFGSTDFLPHRLRETKNQKPWDTPFSNLCRGEQVDNKDQRRLRCYVNNRDCPYLTLQPVRYEHIHNDPEMYLFHDVISDTEISVIKDIATRKLERSVTRSTTNNVTEERVSHTAWLKNSSHPVLLRLAYRIADVTQLIASEDTKGRQAAEDLQILNYGIGGLYNAHNDVIYKSLPEDEWPSAVPEEFEPGDRLATWMFYLSDVIAGGKTAFPEAGIALAPKKGAAVLWFNIKKNGYYTTKALHGGCPVLLGEKWVANRWIRENANFLRRPCSTDPEE